MAKETLYIGIDLGTFRSVMVSSASHEVEELTVIGTPKDPVARNFLKRDVLFGEEALKNRLALNLYRPLELGVIKDTPEDRQYIAHFITHLIGLSDPEDYDRVVAVIGAPAEASQVVRCFTPSSTGVESSHGLRGTEAGLQGVHPQRRSAFRP